MMNRERPRVLRRVIVAGMLALAGCAGRPEGVLVPSGEMPPGVSAVDLLVATTRAPSDQPGVLFSGERGSQLELRDIVVSIPPDAKRKIGQVQWPSKLPADPMKDFGPLFHFRWPLRDPTRERGQGSLPGSNSALPVSRSAPRVAEQPECLA